MLDAKAVNEQARARSRKIYLWKRSKRARLAD